MLRSSRTTWGSEGDPPSPRIPSDKGDDQESAVWIPSHLRPNVSEDTRNPGRDRGSGWGRVGWGRSSPSRSDNIGRWRGNRRDGWVSRGRGFNSMITPRGDPSSPSPSRHALGPLIESAKAEDLRQASSIRNLHLTGFEALASYSWLDKRQPSIIIPGMARRWSPVTSPRRLGWDTGVFYRDQEARHYPSHPMEPAVEAVMHTNPQLTTPVDIFACSNTLFSLYCFASGDPRPFRMLVETIGGTVHLVRRENPDNEKIPNVQGFWHNFVKANTMWDHEVHGSDVHTRIIRHSFAGISSIVRFGVDGYLPDKLGSASTSSSAFPAIPTANTFLQIASAGRSIPQEAVFDLKTRSVQRGATPQEIAAEYLPRLWICQIPNFVVGFHERGLFNDIHIEDIRPALSQWESEHHETLAKFAALLHKIMAKVRNHPDGKLEVNREDGSDVLEIREQVVGVSSTLSGETEARWKQCLGGKGPTPVKEGQSDYDAEFTASSDDEYPYPSISRGGSDYGDDEEPDYTACSADDCGYCGRCTYET